MLEIIPGKLYRFDTPVICPSWNLRRELHGNELCGRILKNSIFLLLEIHNYQLDYYDIKVLTDESRVGWINVHISCIQEAV